MRGNGRVEGEAGVEAENEAVSKGEVSVRSGVRLGVIVKVDMRLKKGRVRVKISLWVRVMVKVIVRIWVKVRLGVWVWVRVRVRLVVMGFD